MVELIRQNPQLGYLAYLAIMSVIAFMAYGIDKKKAIDGQWRTKEKTLLGLSLAGGALGGLLGMKLFRHKTKHWYFWAANYAGIVLHVIVLLGINKV